MWSGMYHGRQAHLPGAVQQPVQQDDRCQRQHHHCQAQDNGARQTRSKEHIDCVWRKSHACMHPSTTRQTALISECRQQAVTMSEAWPVCSWPVFSWHQLSSCPIVWHNNHEQHAPTIHTVTRQYVADVQDESCYSYHSGEWAGLLQASPILGPQLQRPPHREAGPPARMQRQL